jgi:hypothetical protein
VRASRLPALVTFRFTSTRALRALFYGTSGALRALAQKEVY